MDLQLILNSYAMFILIHTLCESTKSASPDHILFMKVITLSRNIRKLSIIFSKSISQKHCYLPMNSPIRINVLFRISFANGIPIDVRPATSHAGRIPVQRIFGNRISVYAIRIPIAIAGITTGRYWISIRNPTGVSATTCWISVYRVIWDRIPIRMNRTTIAASDWKSIRDWISV